MRFTYFLSAFLATLAVASPISSGVDVAEGVELVARADTVVESAEYQALKKVHPSLEENGYYWVWQKDRLGAKIQDGDTETLSELEQLQKTLGFEHIGVIVGQVTYHKTGTKKKGFTTTKKFEAMYYHMTKNKDKQNAAVTHSSVWQASRMDPKSYLEDGGKANKAQVAKAKTNYQTYLDNQKHKTYSVTDNNCNTFAQEVRSAFK